MKIFYTVIIFLFTGFILHAQTTTDFENFGLDTESFLNGDDGQNEFSSGNVTLINNYNSDWSSWDGWAITNTTDSTTPGFTNQYSSISGTGNSGSETYATSFIVGESLIYTTNAAEGGTCKGFYINNTTYAYLSIKDGDAFAKKFGGEDGTDPDFFRLTIKKKGIAADSVDFYLADYRSDNDSEDYIVDEWTFVDLESLGNVDTLSFTLSSSDVGMFGMNTPAYFCIDDFATNDMLSANENIAEGINLSVYPVPTSDWLNIESKIELIDYQIFDMDARLVQSGFFKSKNQKINLSQMASGQYNLLLTDNKNEITLKKIYKH